MRWRLQWQSAVFRQLETKPVGRDRLAFLGTAFAGLGLLRRKREQ